MTIKEYHGDHEMPNEELLHLVHTAFEDRVKQGFNFICAAFSLETFRSLTHNSYIFVAQDEHSPLIGTVALTERVKRGIRCGELEYLAVLPDYNRKGIATMLLTALCERARKLDLPFIISDTAMHADSSVKWHLRNGFKILRIKQFDKRNYYSYQFVKPIKTKSSTIIVMLLRRIIFFTSYIIYRIKTIK